MRIYFILSVFLLLFGGCSQKKSYYSRSMEEITRSGNYAYNRSIENHHEDIKNLNNEIENLLDSYRITGNNKIGKVDMSYYKSSFSPMNYNDTGMHNKKKEFNKKSKVKIKFHNYQTIDSKYELKELKGIVTYILFPRNLIGQNIDTKKYKRYVKILELIQELKKVNKTTSKNRLMNDYENKFILPKVKSKNKDKVTVETYNYELSNEILDFFKAKLTPLFFDKDGPFLITVVNNIFSEEKLFRFMYLDLSTFNESAINQALNSYKHRLVNKGDGDITILEEWHYNILSAITNFNDNLHLFQVAVAGED